MTEVVFILDRSGSMGGMEEDTIGGFNALLKRQMDEPGECRITTVLFDHRYEVLHDRIDVKAVSPMTGQEYFVRGNTALLDAIGSTIMKIGNVQKSTAEAHRADKVLFVITTDGMENASREYSYDKIKTLIEHQKSKYCWEFLFLGANIDAVAVANRFGVDECRAQSFHNDSEGIALNYQVLSETVAMFRNTPSEQKLDDKWSARIKENFKKRGGKK